MKWNNKKKIDKGIKREQKVQSKKINKDSKKCKKKYSIAYKPMLEGVEEYQFDGIRKGLDFLFGKGRWDIISEPVPIFNDENYFVFIGYKQPDKTVNCKYRFKGKEYSLYDDFAIIGCNIKKCTYKGLNYCQIRKFKKMFPNPIKPIKRWKFKKEK